MILIFSDGSQSSNFMGISALSRSYQKDKAHRTQYLSALWNTAGEGTGGGLLKNFEIDCMSENTLAREYKAATSASSSANEAFLKDPKLERLEFLCTNPPCRTLLEYDHLHIVEQNRSFWDGLLQYTVWDHESVRALRLLLILLLQLKQADSVQLEPEEMTMLEQVFRSYQLASAPQKARVYPFQDGALLLRDGMIYQAVFDERGAGTTTAVSGEKEVLLDFAPYAEVQRMELTASGMLTSASASDVYKTWTSHGSPPLSGIGCYGSLYLLLEKSGGFLSNVEDVAGEWKDPVWVGAGLNSVYAICGEERRLYASIPIQEHTDVREALTYYDGMEAHYGALMETGSLIVDGRTVGEASAAAICSLGVVFVQGKQFFLYRFARKRAERIAVCSGTVEALCVEDCTSYTPPQLRIIWMTKTEVSRICLNV